MCLHRTRPLPYFFKDLFCLQCFIDKVGNDYPGDPLSAFLEALDPEQYLLFYFH